MKNTVINQSSANLNQTVVNAKDKFSQFNNCSSSRAFMESGHDFIELQDRIYHYYTLSSDELSSLLKRIIKHSRPNQNVAQYFLSKDNVMCFQLVNTVYESIETIYVYDAVAKYTIEETLGITFQSKVLSLNTACIKCSKVKRGSKKAKSKKSVVELDSFWHNVTLTAGTQEAFKAGVSHISHVIEATPEFAWEGPVQETQEGGLYKALRFIPDFGFVLEIHNIVNGDFYPIYGFRLAYSSLLNNWVDSYLNSQADAIDMNLQLVLGSMYRKDKIAILLDVIESNTF